MGSAGVTLVKGDLRGIVRARRLSRKTMAHIRQNLLFAFAYRKVLGVDGAKATMPKDDPGSNQGKELERIIRWSNGVGSCRCHHSKSAPDGDSGHKH